MMKRIGLGGGCHWCTEAVFQSLKGVQEVGQGWIASLKPNDDFSEAIIVTYNPYIISLQDIIEVHLHTHSSTSNHSIRDKYRSAVYWFDETDEDEANKIISALQPDFEQKIITQVLPFIDFKASLPEHQDYYYSNPEKPFCTLYIHPKLQFLQRKFSGLISEK